VTDSPSPLPVAKPKKASASDQVTKLATLVVLGAVLLGAGGAAGLYLTRGEQ
jgi:hypothetical protein